MTQEKTQPLASTPSKPHVNFLANMRQLFFDRYMVDVDTLRDYLAGLQKEVETVNDLIGNLQIETNELRFTHLMNSQGDKDV